MRFRKDLLLNYMSAAPLALAFERFMECCIFSQLDFQRPILDLGCGDGLFAHILFDEPVDTGIDPDVRELDRARKRNIYLELIECTGGAVPKSAGAYNTIFSNSVLEHIPELEPVLHEVHRLLAPGGSFYMTVPSPLFEQFTVLNSLLASFKLRSLASWYRRFCSEVLWKQYHYYTLSGWQSVVKSQGFRVVDARTYDPKAICLLNDFLYPFGGVGLISKLLLNRWVLFPRLRRITMRPLAYALERVLARGVRTDRGGLVFLALEKGENA